MSQSARASAAWVITAHVCGAAMIGALDSARLHSVGIASAAVPLFAFLGLLAGVISLGAEQVAAGRRWWSGALILGAPALVVFVPVAWTLFDGAYAQTLAVARVAPYVLPLALWLASAGASGAAPGGRRNGDRTSRASVLLAEAGGLGAVIWLERHLLGTGYPSAHIAATLVACVLGGLAVRVTHRGLWPRRASIAVTTLVASLVVGLAAFALLRGLGVPHDRQLLATFGDQTRDVVMLARALFDGDSDGSSPLLGGGDCDDGDARRHPGAIDAPGDGVDQDCDGADAVAVAAHVAPEPQVAKGFHERDEVVALLARSRGMNVLLVSVDALRADMLAPGAPGREDFPHLTKLLDESVWFTRAFAPASGTDVSLATLLTGRHNPFQAVASTLPEAMKASGRATYAAIPNEVLRYAGDTLLNRGVDKVTTVYTDWTQADVGDHISAAATTSAGVHALEAVSDAPFFLWVHYFDVHEHHQITVPDNMLAKVQRGESAKSHSYRALLRGIDDQIGTLRAQLEQRGMTDKTIIVFLSDHGESLGEDPRLLATHGKVTYAPLVRVPLAFHIPGMAPGQRHDLVSLVDVVPTLLHVLDIDATGLSLDGADLVPALLDGPAELRPSGRAIAIHEQDQWSVVEWPHQLLVRPADNVVELYDLERDPAQQHDLSKDDPALVQRLKARYAEFPSVVVDRTPQGRSAREQLARQRPAPAR